MGKVEEEKRAAGRVMAPRLEAGVAAAVAQSGNGMRVLDRLAMYGHRAG